MALKGDRYEALTDNSFFMNATSERGYVVVHGDGSTLSGGSGIAMDQAEAIVSLPGTVNGSLNDDEEPAGVLLNDVVNLDLTRQHLNQHQDEVQQGGKVLLLKQGWIVTDAVDSSTPLAGMKAYFDSDGKFTAASGSGQDAVGRFLSKKDADSYVKVWINIV
jgi:hypothetical protein